MVTITGTVTDAIGATASWSATATQSAASGWFPLKVGGGGQITHGDYNSDGTWVFRTDVYGAYISNQASGPWQQLVNTTSIPGSFVAQNNNSGVMEILIAPSNSSIIYMMYLGYIFVSTNRGGTWTQTAFTKVTDEANQTNRDFGQKMGIHPTNPAICLAGTPTGSLFYTTNTGASWTAITTGTGGVPAGAGLPGIYGIQFDPTSNTIYACSYPAGIYQTTGGVAGSWSRINSGVGPQTIFETSMGPDGTYYVIDRSNGELGNIWKYASGAWTEILAGASVSGIGSVAVDPKNASHLIAVNWAGLLNESKNGGSTWGGWSNGGGSNHATFVLNDIPWLAALVPYFQVNKVFIDNNYATTGKLYVNAQNDPFVITLSGADLYNGTSGGITSTTNVHMVGVGTGYEELVGNQVICPPGGVPVCAAWDHGVFYKAYGTFDSYATTLGPAVTSNLEAAWNIDWASTTPSFLVCICDECAYGQTREYSSYSTNGGLTWTQFSSWPVSGSISNGAGSIAVSTPSNFVLMAGGSGGLWYTTNGGTSWTKATLPGSPPYTQINYYQTKKLVAADRVLANTFYVVVYGYGLYISTNGGATWTLQWTTTASASPNFYYGSTVGWLETMPGQAGYLYAGSANGTLGRSTNQGATWTALSISLQNAPNGCGFGFGAPKSGYTLPCIYVAGTLGGVYGIYQSPDGGTTWTLYGGTTWPLNIIDRIEHITGDMNNYGYVYVSFNGSGFAYYTP